MITANTSKYIVHCTEENKRKYIFSQYKEVLFIRFWWCLQAVYCHPAYLTYMQSTS